MTGIHPMTLPGDPFESMPSEASEAYEPGAWGIGGDAFEAAQIPPITSGREVECNRQRACAEAGEDDCERLASMLRSAFSIEAILERQSSPQPVFNVMIEHPSRDLHGFRYIAPTVDRLFRGPGAEDPTAKPEDRW